jgi:hypothetical protein
MPFLAGALAALGAGWVGFPHAIYKSRPQPVDFSHKVHAEKAGTKCEDCHAFREDGTFAGIPSLSTCAACHAAPMGTTAAEKNFIDHYVTPNREPDWASYAQQPENVFFSHITHVKLGQLKCEQCHGDQGASDKLRPLPGGPHQRLLARHLGPHAVSEQGGGGRSRHEDGRLRGLPPQARPLAQLSGLP